MDPTGHQPRARKWQYPTQEKRISVVIQLIRIICFEEGITDSIS